MSESLAEITPILEIKAHPNADRLEIAVIKGWQVVVQKDLLKVGENIVFIPPDCILPESLHTFLGITKYCAELPKNQNTKSRRVKAAKIRGIASYGTIMTISSFTKYMSGIYNKLYKYLPNGLNITEDLEITKWNPPLKSTQGDVHKDHPLFHKYTKIENIRNHPNILQGSEFVRITLKIHGTNTRIGLVNDCGKPTFMCGSHNTRRKYQDKEKRTCLYWQPLDWYPDIQDLLKHLHSVYKCSSAIVFGEIYGSGVQNLSYGMENGKKDFRVFDVSIDGKYLGYEELQQLCSNFKIPMVPIIYVGPWSNDLLDKYTDGESILPLTGKFKGREGIVITPLKEREHPTLGRIIFKSISVEYLSR